MDILTANFVGGGTIRRSLWRNWKFVCVSGMGLAAMAIAAVFLARFGGRVSLPFDAVIVACAFAMVVLWSRMYRHYLALRELFPEALREESREAYLIASLLTSDYLGLFYFSLAVGLLLVGITRFL
jgi:hypothetical protein